MTPYVPPAGRALLAVLLAVAAGVLVWLLLIRGDGGSGGETSSSSLRAGAGPSAAQAEDLVALEGRLGIPVYWAGEPGDETLELTRTADDRIYVRYLDQGVEPGDPDPSFLTVGTYPLDGAFKLIEKAAQRDGAVVEDGPGGSLVVTNEDSLTSVYVGFPGEEYQVEVYDPDPDRALDLATSGQIEPAG